MALDGPRPGGLDVICQRAEVDDFADRALTGENVQQGLTEGAQIEPTHPRVGIVLAVATRVIEVEAVDEAQHVVDE